MFPAGGASEGPRARRDGNSLLVVKQPKRGGHGGAGAEAIIAVRRREVE